MATMQQLEAVLAALDGQMERMKAEYPDEGDFICAFAGVADGIADSANSDQYDWVHQQLDGLLKKHGIAVPRDQSPSDC